MEYGPVGSALFVGEGLEPLGYGAALGACDDFSDSRTAPEE